ncbi:MAG: SMI1/KNR4 family protein [Acutalibacteraceae bacterium]|nr:SMI1/KNR4 family protein [Acutalibacteraceae bacterium]
MMKILEMMKDMDLNIPSNINILHNMESKFEIKFPKQYFDFMKIHNGGEGPIGEYGYLAVWDTEEIFDYNSTSSMKNFLPELFYFASDRGGTIYAFDMRNASMNIVELPDDSIDYSEVQVIANSFEEFITYIYEIDDSEYI